MVDVVALVIPPKKNSERGNESPDSAHRFWEKRQAIQLVAQLPEDREGALRVLEYAKQLVIDFWTAEGRPREQ